MPVGVPADDVPPQKEISRHLVFRGGFLPADQHEEEAPSSSAEEEEDDGSSKAVAGAPPPSHCYLAVPPTPGSLWLFPGSVPHCVISGGVSAAEQHVGEAAARDQDAEEDEKEDPDEGDEGARISIAINYTKATAPLPTPPAPLAVVAAVH